MYTNFYGLEEKPFALVPDPRYLFLSKSHREALAHLLYGIREGEGFIEVVGQVGTGKTTLCRTVLERVEGEAEVAFVFNPSCNEVELLTTLNREFGISVTGRTRAELIDQLNRFLLHRRAAGRRVLLLIDEAQNLSPEVLEQIRLLSNLETEREKLLQILLLGQPELDVQLARPDLRQLRQRITVRWELRPLSCKETKEYVEHRLRIAGARNGNVFTPGAMRALYRGSRGVPRLINALADRALLSGYSEGTRQISARTVRRAARELPASGRGRLLRGPTTFGARASALVAWGLVGGLLVASWSVGREGGGGELASVEGAPPASTAAAEVRPAAMGFEERLQLRSEGQTAALALNAVLGAWGYGPLELETSDLSPADFPVTLAGRTPLLVLNTHSDLSGLQRLNLPAVLELRPDPETRRYVALLEVPPDGTLVIQEDGRSFPLARENLERLWTGRALLLWTNFDSVPVLRPGMQGTAVLWLQDRLVSLGYLRADSDFGEFDAVTEAAVRQLQSARGLDATGEVGAKTLIAIYHALRYGAPVLSEQPEAPREIS